MSDDPVKQLGFLYDPNGDLSSGRLIKILSFVMSAVMAIGGVIAIAFVPVSGPTLSGYCSTIAAMFLATATGTELIQKVTGK